MLSFIGILLECYTIGAGGRGGGLMVTLTIGEVGSVNYGSSK
jgi:hypothetical protein